MSWWMEQAGRIQAATRESEAEKTWDNYDEDAVKRAIVRTREDSVVITSLLESLNRQIHSGNRLLVAIANTLFLILIALIYICYKIY